MSKQALRARVTAPGAPWQIDGIRDQLHILKENIISIGSVSVPVYAWDARGIGHADGLDWAPNSVGARCLLRHHVHSAFCRPPIESWSLVAVYRGVTRAVSH